MSKNLKFGFCHLDLGFSLIEVIIAMGVILATLLIYAGSLATVPLTREIRDEAQAYRIAGRQLELLRATAFAALPASGAIADPNLAALPGAAAGNFTVSDYPGATNGFLKQVAVTVSWPDRQTGLNRQVRLNTLMTPTGFNSP